MRTRQNPLALAAVLVIVVAGCAAHHSQANRSPSALEAVSDDATSFPLRRVVTPPTGYPGGSMSTDDNNRERQGYLGYGTKPDKVVKEEPKAVDRVVYPQAAPQARPQVAVAPERKIHKRLAVVKSHKAKPHHRKVAKVASRKRLVRHLPAAVKVSPAVSRLREVEALNRLHHLNLAEIALADIALARSPSSSTLAMAQQSKEEHQRAEERVKAVAAKLDITLETFSPATYEIATKNELARNDTHFNELLAASLERARSDAAHDLSVARTETMRDHDVVALIDEEKPLLTANRLVPARYRNEAVAHQGDADLGK